MIGPAVNGARRWISIGPAVFQPSELAKLSLAVWAAAYLSRRPPPRTLQQLARPVGLLAGMYALLLLAEPDLGTAIALFLMLGAMLLVAGTPARVLALALLIAGARRHARDLDRALPPRALLLVPPPLARRAGIRASRSCRR